MSLRKLTEFQGIIKAGGFKKMYKKPADEDFLWWSLSVSENDIDIAENNFLKEQSFSSHQRPLLKYFTNSPAFQSDSRDSRNFKFTLPLKELLYQYARQFCRDSAPVLRVMDTRMYKKEIMYCVLVHPQHVRRYGRYPRFPRSNRGVCWYSQKQMSWCCQSPSDAYRYRLLHGEVKVMVPLNEELYYVWDHVAVGFHMESN